jgi:hypothetical protein
MAETKNELSQLSGLMDQLQQRRLFAETKACLKSQDVGVGVGWAGMEDGLLAAKKNNPEWPSIVKAFETYVREAVLVSQKKAFVLMAKPAAVKKFAAKMLPPLPDDIRKDYLASEVPDRVAYDAKEGDFAYYLGSASRGSATIYTFVTQRPAKRTEDVELESLTPGGQRKYRGADLVAKFHPRMRCYDHLVLLKDRVVLLVDAPGGVDKSWVWGDEYRYTQLLRAHLEAAEEDPMFVDLFPAVAKLWKNGAEGVVNLLGFMSNNGAYLEGKFSKTSDVDYRNHRFQKGGQASGALVLPVRIRIRWPTRNDNPMVLLPGSLAMVTAGGGIPTDDDGGPTSRAHAALNHMEFPLYMHWPGFEFALDRVLHHV